MKKTHNPTVALLQELIRTRGLDYLRESGGKFFVNAFAEMGGEKQDVTLLRYLTQYGGHEDLLDAAALTPAMQRAYYSQAVQKLCDKALIPEALAHRICGNFWQAVYNTQPPVSAPVPPTPPPEEAAEELFRETQNRQIIPDTAKQLEEKKRQEAPEPSGNRPEFDIVNGALLKYNGTAAKVTVPGGVTRIGAKAFFGNDFIRSVTLPYGLIGMGVEAFAGCRNLQEITISGSVIAVNLDIFAGCRKLKKITLESGVQKLIFGDHLDQLGNVSIVIPDSVSSVTWSSMPDSQRAERMKHPKSILASKSWTDRLQDFFSKNPDFRSGKSRRFRFQPVLILVVVVLMVIAVVLPFVSDPDGRTRSDLAPYKLEDSAEDMLLAGTEHTYTYPDGTWMEFYYDDAGKEIYRVYVNTENEIENLFEARYDSAGRLVYHQIFDGQGNLLRADSYDFHSNEDTAQRRITLGNRRNLQGVSTFDENGYETFTLEHQDGTKTVYVYKDGGVLTNLTEYDAAGEIIAEPIAFEWWETQPKVYGPQQTVIGWVGSNGYVRPHVQGICGGKLKTYSVADDHAFIETYDSMENPLEQLYYRDGQLNELGSREIYSYDAQGNYTGYTETFYRGFGELPAEEDYYITTYDANGIKLSSEDHYGEDVSYERYETALDEQGREIRVQTFDGETGQLISIVETEYGKDGNAAKKIRTYYHDNGDYSITVRDGEGKITSDITYYPSGNIQTEDAYNSEGQRIKATRYYESGQVQSIAEYSATGETLSRNRYYENGNPQHLDEYDAQGNLTISTSYDENGKVESLTEYNSQGNIRKMASYYENGQLRYLMEYNDQGENTKQVYYNEDGTVLK